MGAVEGRFSVKAEDISESFIGGRRLGAWEAVVFGEPYVESAQAMVNGGGSLSPRAMVSKTSVAMPIRLE
jgi:hypothetical protein